MVNLADYQPGTVLILGASGGSMNLQLNKRLLLGPPGAFASITNQPAPTPLAPLEEKEMKEVKEAAFKTAFLVPDLRSW